MEKDKQLLSKWRKWECGKGLDLAPLKRGKTLNERKEVVGGRREEEEMVMDVQLIRGTERVVQMALNANA